MTLIDTDRVFAETQASATQGRIRWQPAASLWLFGHMIGGVLAITVYPSWGGMAAFLTLCGLTLCAGHSVGMHRLLIHRSFTAPQRAGTLFGLAWNTGRHGRALRNDPRP